MPSEIAIQDEVFKLPAWLWLVITFLLSVLYLFPFTVAQALLLTSVCECKDVTQLLCTQATGKLHVPTASGSYILCGSSSSLSCRSIGVNPASQFSGGAGEDILSKNFNQVSFCISALQG